MTTRFTFTFAIFTALLFARCEPKTADASVSAEAINTPSSPRQRLEQGNERFYTGSPTHPNVSIGRLKTLAKEQHPFAVIISCSDSRAPDEIVFDQGLGDLFVIRTAGNVIADIGLGSIEYATDKLNVKYILVMGHQGCGAVKAFAEHLHPTNHINTILDTLINENEIKQIGKDSTHADYLTEVVKANVLHQMHKITHGTEAMARKVQQGEIVVQGAVYSIANGKVSFLTDEKRRR
ncbi:carbonic anhydrase [Chryseolinea lacunae]|uniref:Carbonic anhydrase n=1 Tax=Chryseolinea lacunae TaxID=2801331 RepID=A0ABS1KK90_9BACT|nr:carbonic anhydrase [Chryseolinea lacunae]MBL0739861.1 carbonic anhydrase [Chryseolinea lacunae]